MTAGHTWHIDSDTFASFVNFVHYAIVNTIFLGVKIKCGQMIFIPEVTLSLFLSVINFA